MCSKPLWSGLYLTVYLLSYLVMILSTGFHNHFNSCLHLRCGRVPIVVGVNKASGRKSSRHSYDFGLILHTVDQAAENTLSVRPFTYPCGTSARHRRMHPGKGNPGAVSNDPVRSPSGPINIIKMHCCRRQKAREVVEPFCASLRFKQEYV
jgi:hypothetical protein